MADSRAHRRITLWAFLTTATTAGLLGAGIALWATAGLMPKPLPGPAPAAPARGADVRLVGDDADGPDANVNAGWIDDPAAVRAVVADLPDKSFGETDAGRAVTGDEDVYLFDAPRQVLGDVIPPRDQLDVGSCVGFGNASAIDHLQCVEIVAARKRGERGREFREACQEAIYGGSRVEVGGGRLRGDGSVGAWAAKWVAEVGGVLWRGKFGALTKYDTRRCREWGSRGVPDDLEAQAKMFPVKAYTLAKSGAELAAAIRQGYTAAICSNQGFSKQRDAEGFARAQGNWAHCMAVLAVKGGKRPGFWIQNSWGNHFHVGPKGAGNPPDGGFWAEFDVVDRMVRRGQDTWVFSAFDGFPARKMDWFAHRPTVDVPTPRRDTDRHLVAAAEGHHVAW
jgi:hypothetical protein